MKWPWEKGAPDHPSPRTTEERLAALEARAAASRWWKNPVWLSLLLAVALGVNQIKPWDWFEGAKPKPKPKPPPPQVVSLISPHAAAFGRFQWEADVRVLNATKREITVERVTAVFGKASYGRKCNKRGNATRVLYPEVEPGRTRNVYQPLKPGAGARFRGSPNWDRLNGGQRCALAIGKLTPGVENPAMFTAYTDDGKDWTVTTKLLYKPEAQVEGAGSGGFCLPFIVPGCPL